MSKPQNEAKSVLPEPAKGKKNGKELAAAVKSAFDGRAKEGKGISDFKISVAAPHTGNSVVFSKIESVDNVVKVWTNGNVGEEPDYVIVNPPNEVQISKTETVEDPLAAIAQAIDGASR